MPPAKKKAKNPQHLAGASSARPQSVFSLSGNVTSACHDDKENLSSVVNNTCNLRNTSASIASCWIQFHDRVKVKVCTTFCHLTATSLIVNSKATHSL
jgi:hypothetical protein